MRDRDPILVQKLVTVSFSLEPAFNVNTSLMDILCTQKYLGMSAWLHEAEHMMSAEMLHNHRIVYDALSYHVHDVLPAQDWPTFLDYVNKLESVDPDWYRDMMLERLQQYPVTWGDAQLQQLRPPDLEALLANYDVYKNWISTIWPEYTLDDQIGRESHALLNAPDQMIALFVSHMRQVWHEIMAPEWQRSLPMLQESIRAYQQLEYSSLTAYEAIRAVTGRDLLMTWPRKFDSIDHIIFVPSPHSGPYVTKFIDHETNTLRLIFGARLPKGTQVISPDLTRSEVLVRLNALADDTRLRILELLTREPELCSNDIIARLELSQSATSRHLSQLAATGYITERRRELTKCYSLNTERIEDTIRALSQMLKKKV